jgi:O-antigen ligase
MNTHPVISRLRAWRLAGLLLLIGALLLALAATFWADNALNRGIDYTPDPQPVTWADGPQVGVNVFNLHVEPDPQVVTRTLQLAHDLGVRYVRMQVPWEDIEIHGRGDFTDRRNVEAIGEVSAWAKYDRIVNTADALGLELVLRVDRPPDWARRDFIDTPFFQEGLQEDATSTGPPDDFADYGAFLTTLVTRYREQVRFYQIWNEPNLKNEWNWQTPRPEDFVDLLRVGATAVRAANPQAVIVFPSLAPVDGLDKRAPMTELEYLDRVYRAGGAEYFDIMSVQAYGLGQPPDEHRYVRLPLPWRDEWTWRRPLDTRVDVSRVVLLREIMERHGDEHTAIWVGEFGWNSAPESIPAERRYTWGEPVSEQQKADYLIGHIERAQQEWPWMGTMFVWKLRYGGYREPDPADPTPYFALVQRDWEPLPAYHRLQDHLAQPRVAGLGAHSWEHPAIEQTTDGWRLRFSGQQVTLYGAPAGSLEARLNGEPLTLEPVSNVGTPALRTPWLPETGPHTLELAAPNIAPPSHIVVARAPPLPLWLWVALPTMLLSALLATTIAAMPGIFGALRRFEGWATIQIRRSPPAQMGLRPWLATAGGERALLLAMAGALLIFYGFTVDLPTRVLGAALFGLLALVRPDLALLYVPLTAPLFFLPKGIWDTQFGLPPEGKRIALHEVVLFATAGATALRWLVARARERSLQFTLIIPWQTAVPAALLLLAGGIGIFIAAPEGRSEAVREVRRMLVEPLLFYGLLHYHGRHLRDTVFRWRVLGFFLAGGAFVGLLGVLQFLGLNLVPLIGDKVGFSNDRIFVEGVQRVSSVYGHPNNLGLYMGRIWPLAAVMLLAAWAALRARPAAPRPAARPLHHRLWVWVVRRRHVLFYGACTLLALGGLLVSFSKGALLGASGAALLLLVLLWRHNWWAATEAPANERRSQAIARLAGFVAGALVVLLPLTLAALLLGEGGPARFNLFGESTDARLKLWASSLAMLRDHPLFGVGPDQFLRVYQDYIHPSLVDTNEQFTSHPHTLLLDVWLRLGVVGVVAFGWLVVRFYRLTLGQGPRTLVQCGLAAAFTAALLHGLVDNVYFVCDLALAFWLLVWLAEEEV